MEITSIDTTEEEEEERNLSLQSTNATEINLNQHLTKTDINWTLKFDWYFIAIWMLYSITNHQCQLSSWEELNRETDKQTQKWLIQLDPTDNEIGIIKRIDSIQISSFIVLSHR